MSCAIRKSHRTLIVRKGVRSQEAEDRRKEAGAVARAAARGEIWGNPHQTLIGSMANGKWAMDGKQTGDEHEDHKGLKVDG